MKETIGIVGGMGSHAAASFFEQLVRLSPAGSDQEHMEILIHNNPRIPDRTAAIAGDGEDPYPELLRSVRLLENGGASVIVLACITAHHYFDRLAAAATGARMLHIARETAEDAFRRYPLLKTVGVLATEGALKAGIWQEAFGGRQIRTLTLPRELRNRCFNEVVYGPNGIKAGGRDDSLKTELLAGCRALMASGAEAVVAGCSELPILLKQRELPVPLLDPFETAARRLIEGYYGKKAGFVR